MKKIVWIFAFLLLLTQPMLAGSAPDRISLGDQFFVQMNYAEAIKQYLTLPNNAEAQWRLARAYVCLADISPMDKQRDLYYKAAEAARQCLKLNINNSYGHTWLGAALGNVANYEGSRSKVKLCNVIKTEVEKAIALNPHDDVAYSILGSFYRALGNITWIERKLANTFLGSLPKGGFAESEAALKKAIQLAPTTVRHWFELGVLYREWGKNAQALKAFKTAQQLTPQLGSDKNRMTKMKELLETKNL